MLFVAILYVGSPSVTKTMNVWSSSSKWISFIARRAASQFVPLAKLNPPTFPKYVSKLEVGSNCLLAYLEKSINAISTNLGSSSVFFDNSATAKSWTALFAEWILWFPVSAI